MDGGESCLEKNQVRYYTVREETLFFSNLLDAPVKLLLSKETLSHAGVNVYSRHLPLQLKT